MVWWGKKFYLGPTEIASFCSWFFIQVFLFVSGVTRGNKGMSLRFVFLVISQGNQETRWFQNFLFLGLWWRAFPEIRMQSCIQSPAKHIWWNSFAKIANRGINCFCKRNPLQMFKWVLNRPPLRVSHEHHSGGGSTAPNWGGHLV